MKREENKLRIKMWVTFKKKRGADQRYFRLKKSQIRALIKRVSFSKCDLKVEYQPDVYNSGEFENKKSALDALIVWTEGDLLDYVEAGQW